LFGCMHSLQVNDDNDPWTAGRGTENTRDLLLDKLLATLGVFKRTALYVAQVIVTTFKTACFMTHLVSFESQSA
jgi:hypothetical protein